MTKLIVTFRNCANALKNGRTMLTTCCTAIQSCPNYKQAKSREESEMVMVRDWDVTSGILTCNLSYKYVSKDSHVVNNSPSQLVITVRICSYTSPSRAGRARPNTATYRCVCVCVCHSTHKSNITPGVTHWMSNSWHKRRFGCRVYSRLQVIHVLWFYWQTSASTLVVEDGIGLLNTGIVR
jgi:hypothetical protein